MEIKLFYFVTYTFFLDIFVWCCAVGFFKCEICASKSLENSFWKTVWITDNPVWIAILFLRCRTVVMVMISIHTIDVSFVQFVPNTQERTHVLLDEGIVGERYCPPAYLGLSSFQNKLTNRL